MATQNIFTYDPLVVKKHEIRLLRLPRKSASSNAPGNYTLIHEPLVDGRSFVALSYCWGGNTLSHSITVNGQTMQITESLALALESLKTDNEDILLWADAICINQRNAVEKTSQVQLMRDIYRTASRVIIWLGPSTTETSYTVPELRKLGDELIEAGMWDLTPNDVLYWDTDDNDVSKAAITKRTISRMKDEHLRKARNDEYPFWWIMSDFGKRDWFHRMWCIQECTNAATATFRCGQDEVDYTHVWAVALYFSSFSTDTEPDLQGDVKAFWKHNWLTTMLFEAIPTTIIGIRRKYLVQGGHDLRTLLDRVIVKDSNTKLIDASDPRDRVFALLGIANDEAAKEIIADYTLTCEDAYIMTARALLKHGHDDVLSLCRIRGTCTNLPSWVPDWSAELRKPWSIWHPQERLFNADGGTARLTFQEIAEEDKFTPYITLRGFIVDTITAIGYKFINGINDTINWKDTKAFFKDAAAYLAQSPRYTDTQKREAEWRIPIGDTEIADTNSQPVRAAIESHMIAGFADAKAMSGLGTWNDDTEKDHLPFACFCCQFGRMYDSRPFMSHSGYVGLSSSESQLGDVIVIFSGVRVPYIVRKLKGETGWVLVGESHVYGIMDGEFMSTNPAAENIRLH